MEQQISDGSIVALGREIVALEARTLLKVGESLKEDFERAVMELARCKGKIVTAGVGKSGLIAKKIASTMASLGSESFSLDVLDALHGDLGMISASDVVLLFSASGETEELVLLLPFIKRMDAKVLAFTTKSGSSLAQGADLTLVLPVEGEAPPLRLAPTCSTTAFLAVGDALALCLATLKGFQKEDFALRHPSGALGHKLHLRVKDLMHTGEALPKVFEGTPMAEAILEISSKGLGVTAVLDAEKNRLVGVITDGDLRRAIQSDKRIWERLARDIMTSNPKRVLEEALALEALEKMEQHAITALCVTNEFGCLVGVVHMHDILKPNARQRA
jgi:arabinose-5-phosphate isomerase